MNESECWLSSISYLSKNCVPLNYIVLENIIIGTSELLIKANCVYVWCYGCLILDEEGDWRYKARGRQVARRSDESDSSRTSRRANRDDFTENG